VRPPIENPQLYERVNVGGTVKLLELARQLGVKRFIFRSSSSVYGIRNRVPLAADTPACDLSLCGHHISQENSFATPMLIFTECR
jgi:nucleoside-diphosphate-sugar epimerase